MKAEPQILMARVYDEGLYPIESMRLTTQLCEKASTQTENSSGWASFTPLEVAVRLANGEHINFSDNGVFCYKLYHEWSELDGLILESEPQASAISES